MQEPPTLPIRDPGETENDEWWMTWGSGYIFGLLTAAAIYLLLTLLA